MSKKEVKSKVRRTSETTKKRRKKKIKLKNTGAIVALLLFTIAVLFASYEFLGLKLTIVVALTIKCC